jgi:glycosyltransferase involved in cell wall biosynthesis
VTAHVGYHGEVDLARLAGRYRTIVLYRVPWDEKVRGLLADPRGSTVLADVDDLVFDPEHVGEIRALAQLADSERAAFADAVGRLRRTLEAVDGVTVSTEPLQAHAQRVNEHVEVVHNAVGSDMVARANRVYSRTRDRRNGPVIAYLSGTPTHDADFDEAADAVLELLETDTAVEFWAVGTLTLDRRFAAFGERVRRIALLPFSRLPDLLAQIDVNLAPLEADNEFTDSKSALKYLEAGLLGVPTLASATSDFRRVIRHGENGLLARNHNEWIDGLHRLAASAELRRGLGEAARSDVLTHHTTAAQATETHRALLAVSERVDTMLRSQ